jgi:uncharacterized protein (TIGR03435 family)
MARLSSQISIEERYPGGTIPGLRIEEAMYDRPAPVSASGGNLFKVLLAATAVAGSLGQSQTPAPREFAVASVKASQRGNAGGEGSEREKISISPGGLIMRNVSLRSCIRWAYGVRDYQISGPGWLASERYEIAAKSSAPASSDELRQMAQKLLADRFKLTLHRESRELPVYAMVAGKKGAKLRPAAGGETTMLPLGGALVFRNCSMAELADRLGARPFSLDRLVLDKTGLDGAFDFTLKFSDNAGDLKHTLEGMEQGGGDQGPSMFTILEGQLGLAFKTQRAPVASLVIDHAEKIPTEN